jgi:hypothetical protein
LAVQRILAQVGHGFFQRTLVRWRCRVDLCATQTAPGKKAKKKEEFQTVGYSLDADKVRFGASVLSKYRALV